MATAITMPKWGMIMENGIIVNWIKEVGEEIEKDEVILEIESEKVVNEFNSPVSGILHEILIDEGEEVDVGTLIGIVLGIGEDPGEAEKLKVEYSVNSSSPKEGYNSASIEEEKRETLSAAPSPVSSTGTRQAVSPAARKMIEEAGIDLGSIRGSGPGGRIIVEDAKAAIAASGSGGIQLSPVRRAIAAKTIASIQAPQAAMCRELDVTNLLELRRKEPVSLTACLVKLTAKALQKVPILNSTLADDKFISETSVNIGVVIQTEEAIIIPVISDVNNKRLDTVSSELKELSAKGIKGQINSSDIQGGTFTISNAGNMGIDFFQPLLNPPEVGALGIGAVKERPVVINGKLDIRNTVWFCLATDHRLVDAGPAGEFLQVMSELIIQQTWFYE